MHGAAQERLSSIESLVCLGETSTDHGTEPENAD